MYGIQMPKLGYIILYYIDGGHVTPLMYHNYMDPSWLSKSELFLWSPWDTFPWLNMARTSRPWIILWHGKPRTHGEFFLAMSAMFEANSCDCLTDFDILYSSNPWMDLIVGNNIWGNLTLLLTIQDCLWEFLMPGETNKCAIHNTYTTPSPETTMANVKIPSRPHQQNLCWEWHVFVNDNLVGGLVAIFGIFPYKYLGNV